MERKSERKPRNNERINKSTASSKTTTTSSISSTTSTTSSYSPVVTTNNKLSEPLNRECKTSKDSVVKSCSNNSKQNMKSKKLRRGTKRSKNIKRTVTLFFNNIDGVLSKSNSLKSVMSHLKPDTIMLCETKLSAKKNYNLEGYTTFQKNKNVQCGGLIIEIKNCLLVQQLK